jgi:hypothetical protein
MSDLSHPHCKTCGEPDYACECDDPDLIEPALNFLMRGEEIPSAHPFRKARSKGGGSNSVA